MFRDTDARLPTPGPDRRFPLPEASHWQPVTEEDVAQFEPGMYGHEFMQLLLGKSRPIKQLFDAPSDLVLNHEQTLTLQRSIALAGSPSFRQLLTHTPETLLETISERYPHQTYFRQFSNRTNVPVAALGNITEQLDTFGIWMTKTPEHHILDLVDPPRPSAELDISLPSDEQALQQAIATALTDIATIGCDAHLPPATGERAIAGRALYIFFRTQGIGTCLRVTPEQLVTLNSGVFDTSLRLSFKNRFQKKLNRSVRHFSIEAETMMRTHPEIIKKLNHVRGTFMARYHQSVEP